MSSNHLLIYLLMFYSCSLLSVLFQSFWCLCICILHYLFFKTVKYLYYKYLYQLSLVYLNVKCKYQILCSSTLRHLNLTFFKGQICWFEWDMRLMMHIKKSFCLVERYIYKKKIQTWMKKWNLTSMTSQCADTFSCSLNVVSMARIKQPRTIKNLQTHKRKNIQLQ